MKMDPKRCRTMAIVSIACGGVSLFILGPILSTVGVVIGGIAFANASKLIKAYPENNFAQDANKLSKIAVVLCLVCLIANLLSAVFLAPLVMSGTMPVTGPTF